MELIGITEAHLWRAIHPGLLMKETLDTTSWGRSELNNFQIVALAAQRALLREIMRHDYPGQLLDIAEKLGIAPGF